MLLEALGWVLSGVAQSYARLRERQLEWEEFMERLQAQLETQKELTRYRSELERQREAEEAQRRRELLELQHRQTLEELTRRSQLEAQVLRERLREAAKYNLLGSLLTSYLETPDVQGIYSDLSRQVAPYVEAVTNQLNQATKVSTRGMPIEYIAGAIKAANLYAEQLKDNPLLQATFLAQVTPQIHSFLVQPRLRAEFQKYLEQQRKNLEQKYGITEASTDEEKALLQSEWAKEQRLLTPPPLVTPQQVMTQIQAQLQAQKQQGLQMLQPLFKSLGIQLPQLTAPQPTPAPATATAATATPTAEQNIPWFSLPYGQAVGMLAPHVIEALKQQQQAPQLPPIMQKAAQYWVTPIPVEKFASGILPPEEKKTQKKKKRQTPPGNAPLPVY